MGFRAPGEHQVGVADLGRASSDFQEANSPGWHLQESARIPGLLLEQLFWFKEKSHAVWAKISFRGRTLDNTLPGLGSNLIAKKIYFHCWQFFFPSSRNSSALFTVFLFFILYFCVLSCSAVNILAAS